MALHISQLSFTRQHWKMIAECFCDRYGLAYVDISTGEFTCANLKQQDLQEEIAYEIWFNIYSRILRLAEDVPMLFVHYNQIPNEEVQHIINRFVDARLNFKVFSAKESKHNRFNSLANIPSIARDIYEELMVRASQPTLLPNV